MTPYVDQGYQGNTYQNNGLINSETKEPTQVIRKKEKCKVIELSNNVIAHRYPNAVAIYGIGKTLKHEDTGYYVRVAPFENGSYQNWIGVPSFNEVDANEKSLLFLGIYENKLTFVKEGFRNKMFAFHISANDKNWAPLYEHLNLIRKHHPDIK